MPYFYQSLLGFALSNWRMPSKELLTLRWWKRVPTVMLVRLMHRQSWRYEAWPHLQRLLRMKGREGQWRRSSTSSLGNAPPTPVYPTTCIPLAGRPATSYHIYGWKSRTCLDGVDLLSVGSCGVAAGISPKLRAAGSCHMLGGRLGQALQPTSRQLHGMTRQQQQLNPS